MSAPLYPKISPSSNAFIIHQTMPFENWISRKIFSVFYSPWRCAAWSTIKSIKCCICIFVVSKHGIGNTSSLSKRGNSVLVSNSKYMFTHFCQIFRVKLLYFHSCVYSVVPSPILRNFNISSPGCIDNCERYKMLFRIRTFCNRFNMGISLTNISFSGGYRYLNAFSSLAIASVLGFLGHLFVEIHRRYE